MQPVGHGPEVAAVACEATEKSAGIRRTARKRPHTVGNVVDLTEAIAAQVVEVTRSMAAHQTLDRAYRSSQGQIAHDERKQGLPIFTFKASADGARVIEVAVDINDIPAEHVPHVLVPMINAQWARLIRATELIIGCGQELLEALRSQIPSQELADE